MKKRYNDSLIVLSRPYGLVACNQVWYDEPMKRIGFCKDDAYRVGHAAAFLVERATGKLSYVDFGRYHMPPQYGRVRDIETDPYLAVPFLAQFADDGSIANLEEILVYANNHTPYHSEGDMYAAVYGGCSYRDGYDYAKRLQQKGKVPYGPFALGGTNCSRFINSLCRVSFPCRYTRLRWRLAPTITPTTTHNVLVHHRYYYVSGTHVTPQQRKSLLGRYLRNARSSTTT